MGELPLRRSVLYDKAIEVLLMTWNIEGHDPLDKDEVLPQLAYVSFQMMTSGKKSITSDELLDLLKAARADMPEILSYSKISVNEFVQRVEERSSIMTLSGHELVSGRLRPTYEFKHLTFQEYLAASAIVEGWLPIELRDSDFRRRSTSLFGLRGMAGGCHSRSCAEWEESFRFGAGAWRAPISSNRDRANRFRRRAATLSQSSWMSP